MSFHTPARFLSNRFATAAAATVLALLNGGWLNWLSGPQSTFEVEGPVARAQLDVFYVTLWVTMIIFVIVAGVLAYAQWKFRAKSESDEHAKVPDQGHGNPFIELGLIGASVLALVFIAVPTLRVLWFSYDVPAAEKDTAYEVNATGYQWWFRFDYPSEQIEKSGVLTTGNELVIPAGRAVRINLRTTDVIHSFWVPKLAGKVDMIPNRGNHLWLKADKPGYFWGQCAEFCGESHAVMRFRVIALSEEEFAAWVAGQKLAARTVTGAPRVQLASYTFKNPGRNAPGYSEAFDANPLASWKKYQEPEQGEDPALIAAGRKLFLEKTCAGCHTVRGHEGGGNVGPDLTHVGSRTTIAAGLLENTKENLHRWIVDPNGVKPGNKMYMGVGPMAGYMKHEGDKVVKNPALQISDSEATALVAYLHSLK